MKAISSEDRSRLKLPRTLIRVLASIFGATVVAIAVCGLLISTQAALAAGIAGEVALVALLLVSLFGVAYEQAAESGPRSAPAPEEEPAPPVPAVPEPVQITAAALDGRPLGVAPATAQPGA